MSVTFYKLSIVGAALTLLVGCAFKSETPVLEHWDAQMSHDLANAQKSGALEACEPVSGSPFAYRKALLVAGTIGVPDMARDLPGLAILTSQRLQSHLDASERFKVTATHDSSFESMGESTAARVRQLGREYDSQFIVKLELEDLTLLSPVGWFGKLIGDSSHSKRNVLMSLYIYDVEYGTLFHTQRYQRTVSGNVVGFPGNGRTVGAPWFNTNLGQQIDGVLKEMSQQINEQLACVPFSAEVTSVRGADIHINAGYLHGLRTGDTLRIYRRTDLLIPDEMQEPGEDEGWITVGTVFPDHSIAFASDKMSVSGPDKGDVVRAW